jgi:hypothetical protein
MPSKRGRSRAPRPYIFPSAAQGARDFVGREWVLDQIEDWRASGSERFLLLVGEPGWGKSSLSAWLVGPGREPATASGKKRLRKLRQAWSAAYLCSATSGSSVNPTAFCRSLAEQLAHASDGFAAAFLERAAPGQYNIDIDVSENAGQVIGILTKKIVVEAPDVRDVYEQSVRLPLADLEMAQPAADPMFILVDGLDDALTFASPNIVDLLAASTDFPEHVRFLLTSRREERVLRSFPTAHGVRLINLSDAASASANQDDVRKYVLSRLSEPAVARQADAAAGGRDAFVEELVRHADGNFLFARFVLDNPPPADGTVASGDAVPPGLQAAYDHFLARVLPGVAQYGVDPTWDDVVKPFLGTIAVAVPAAPESKLPQWVEECDVPTAMATVGQLTEWVDLNGGSRRLYHRSLADFLTTERLGPVAGEPQPNRFYVAPRAHHEAIVRHYFDAIESDWNGDWAKCDDYGLGQLVPHLEALHRLTSDRTERKLIADRLCNLALDPGFQAAQRARFGDGSATIEAVRLALGVSADAGDPVAIRKRVRRVAESWEPEMRASAARALTELSKTTPNAALDELKALMR